MRARSCVMFCGVPPILDESTWHAALDLLSPFQPRYLGGNRVLAALRRERVGSSNLQQAGVAVTARS